MADKARQKFDSGAMSNGEKSRYFFLGLLLFTVMGEAAYLTKADVAVNPLSDPLSSLIYILGTILGVIYLYKKHQIEKSFIEKYVVMSVAAIPVIIIQVILPIVVVYGIGAAVFFGDVETYPLWYELSFSVLFEIGTYWKLGTYFN